MTNNQQSTRDMEPHHNKIYDLIKRTTKFGEAIIKFVQSIPDSSVNTPLKSQLIRSGTSIGANYSEADGADSKADFRHKISLYKKEAKETTYWIHMFAKALPSRVEDCRTLYQEARELTLIFASILNNKKQ